MIYVTILTITIATVVMIVITAMINSTTFLSYIPDTSFIIKYDKCMVIIIHYWVGRLSKDKKSIIEWRVIVSYNSSNPPMLLLVQGCRMTPSPWLRGCVYCIKLRCVGDFWISLILIFTVQSWRFCMRFICLHEPERSGIFYRTTRKQNLLINLT